MANKLIQRDFQKGLSTFWTGEFNSKVQHDEHEADIAGQTGEKGRNRMALT